MVKLASVRALVFYGPIPSQHIYEFINAGLYVVAAVLMLLGFVLLQQKPWLTSPRIGLVILMIAMFLIIALSLHDLWAHLAGIEFSLRVLFHLDSLLPCVEITVPIFYASGAVLAFAGFLLMLLQINHVGSVHQSYVCILLIAGPAFWVLGSIHNAFQVYNLGNYHQIQVLQKSVCVSFMIGSIIFLSSTIVHRDWPSSKVENAWLEILASVIFVIGGSFNLVKVFKQHHWIVIDGGEHEEQLEDERSSHRREGQRRPLLDGEWGMKKPQPTDSSPIVESDSNAVCISDKF